MDDDVAGIGQNPVAGLLAFDRDIAVAGLLQAIGQVIGDGDDLAVRASGGDHHVVGEGRLALEVDDDDVLGLVVVQRTTHQRKQRLGVFAPVGKLAPPLG